MLPSHLTRIVRYNPTMACPIISVALGRVSSCCVVCHKPIRQFCDGSQFSAKKFLSSSDESAILSSGGTGMVPAGGLKQLSTSHPKIEELNSVFGSMIRGRRYGEAVTAWGRLKRARLFNVETYHLMFRLCQGLGSGEATNVVRRDMAAALTGQDKDAVTMNLYFQALVDSRCLNQAIDFVKDTELKTSPKFMGQLADFLLSRDCPNLTLRVCDIHANTDSDDSEGCVLAAKLRALGMLKRLATAQDMYTERFPDLTSVPDAVQFGLADALSMCDKPLEAFNILKNFHSSSIPIWSIALLMDSLKRCSDYKLAALVYSKIWNRDTLQKAASPDLCDPSATNNTTHLTSVLNSTLHLQTLAKQAANQSECVEKTMKKFLEYPVLEDITSFKVANEDTYKEALFHSTVYPDTISFVRELFDSLHRAAEWRPSPESLTSWASHTGHIAPTAAMKILLAVRQHSDVADVTLQLDHFKHLLSLQYVIPDKDRRFQQKTAIKCVKIIQKMMMERYRLLTSAEAFNLVLEGYGRTGDLGAVFMCYYDMSVAEIPANLNTYHIMIDCVLRDAGHRSSKAVIYRTWRLFLKEAPQIQPDVALLNKLLRCSRICSEYDRAFYILTMLESFTVTPDYTTFEELMMICMAAENKEKLSTVLDMALRYVSDEEAAKLSSIEKAWHQQERKMEQQETQQIGKESQLKMLYTSRPVTLV